MKNVKILGHVSREQSLSLYDNCIGLIYLSVSGPENLPPLEALARGKPVLYSNFFGSFEQLKNNVIYINQIQEFLTLSDKLTLKDIGTTFFIADIFAIKHENLDSRIYLT